MQKTYAGIGSRDLSEQQKATCREIGKWLTQQGWRLHTGAATGADQAFTEGAGAQNTNLYLPWASYEKDWVKRQYAQEADVFVLQKNDNAAFDSVQALHPNAEALPPAIKRLHARNYRIISNVQFVLAWPKSNKYGNLGGTGQGIRIAKAMQIKVFRLDKKEELEKILNKIGIL